MNQGPSQVLKDEYADAYEVNADDFEGQLDANVGGSDFCFALSDDDFHRFANEPVSDNGCVVKKEVTDENAAVKTDDEDDGEDDFEDEQVEQERAKVEPGFFADELELLELTLPQQTQIKDKALKIWNARKLIVYPVSEDELQTPQMNHLLKDSHCTQVIIHVDREKPDAENRFNYLDLVFDSKDEASKATEELRIISSKFNVLNAADVEKWNKVFDESRSVHFSDYESKKWPSCLVCVKYLPHSITEEKLREIFPEAFEVLLYTNERPNLTDTQRSTAFLFYGTPEEATAVVQAKNENKASVDKVRMAFFKYNRITHPQLISPSLMAMSERYVILKEKRKVESLAKIRGGHCATTLEKFNTKLREDETVRKTYGLPIPTVEEMRIIPNLKILKGPEAFKVIKQKGLLLRNREKLLSADPTALEPLVHPENKGLHSGVTNPNKRKRRKIALETMTTPFVGPRPAGPPSLLQAEAKPVLRPPLPKVMRLAPEIDFTSYNEEEEYETEGTTEYSDTTYASTEQSTYAPPPRSMPPQMARRPMLRPLMSRGISPRGIPPRGVRPRGIPPRMPMTRFMVSRPSSMMARPAPLGAQPRPGRGHPMQPRMASQLNSRLMRLAHGDLASSGTTTSFATSTSFGSSASFGTSTGLSSAPRQLMAQTPRPRPAAFADGTMAVPMRRPIMLGHRFPGPGMLIRRGPRPTGRAGWPVRN